MKKNKKACMFNLNHDCNEECCHYKIEGRKSSVDMIEQNDAPTVQYKCTYAKIVEQYKGKVIAGSDNGYSGSIVMLDINDGHIVHIEPYPTAKRMYKCYSDFQPLYVIIEQIFNAPGFRGVASSNFEIMGRYKQILELLDLKYDCVRAVSWRAKLGIKAKGRPAQKAASIEKAKELFSTEDFRKLTTIYTRRDKELHKMISERWPDDNKCESALIAYAAWLTWKAQQAHSDKETN